MQVARDLLWNKLNYFIFFLKARGYTSGCHWSLWISFNVKRNKKSENIPLVWAIKCLERSTTRRQIGRLARLDKIVIKGEIFKPNNAASCCNSSFSLLSDFLSVFVCYLSNFLTLFVMLPFQLSFYLCVFLCTKQVPKNFPFLALFSISMSLPQTPQIWLKSFQFETVGELLHKWTPHCRLDR